MFGPKFKFHLVLVALMPLITNCGFADYLSDKFGLSLILGTQRAQQASVQLIQPPQFEEPLMELPESKPKFGSCEPLKDPGFVGDLKGAKVWVETITVGRKSAQVFHTIEVKRFFNLMELANGMSDALTAAEIPEGVYDTIKIATKNAKVMTRRGDSWPLEIHGNAIEINLSRDLFIANEKAPKKVLVTFCTERNFFARKTGDAFPKYAFHPQIEETVNLSM